jgi:hypothetical protein
MVSGSKGKTPNSSLFDGGDVVKVKTKWPDDGKDLIQLLFKDLFELREQTIKCLCDKSNVLKYWKQPRKCAPFILKIIGPCQSRR